MIITCLEDPGSCLSSILGIEPAKKWSFSIKTKIIWVPGTYNWGILGVEPIY